VKQLGQNKKKLARRLAQFIYLLLTTSIGLADPQLRFGPLGVTAVYVHQLKDGQTIHHIVPEHCLEPHPVGNHEVAHLNSILALCSISRFEHEVRECKLS
jgi:hypothetical protein